MKSDEAKALVYVALAATAIIFAIVAGKKVLQALGLKEDESDRLVDNAVTKSAKMGYFNPLFIKNPPAGTKLITMANARIKASNIYHAIGVVYDTPEQIVSAFANIETKSQVAFLAFVFNTMYQKDLLTFLKEKMDTDEQQKILTGILQRLDTLPNFTV